MAPESRTCTESRFRENLRFSSCVLANVMRLPVSSFLHNLKMAYFFMEYTADGINMFT